MSDYKVAVLGLGAMGLPMATRLTTGLTVHGFDIAQPRLDLASEAGIVPFGSAIDTVAGVDAVLLAVRDSAQLDDVLFGAAGIADSLQPGAVVILTSTVGMDGIPAVVERLAAVGVELVDAPLSGGPVRAGAGDLLIVVGASPAAREKAAPVLDLLASTLTVVGDKAGDGQALKTVNQLLCGVHIAAAAEALALAAALGLEPRSHPRRPDVRSGRQLHARQSRTPDARGLRRGRRGGPQPTRHLRQGHGDRGQGLPRRGTRDARRRRGRAALPGRQGAGTLRPR